MVPRPLVLSTVLSTLLGLAAVGCGPGDDGDAPSAAGLAPSQTLASTAPPPELPPACDVEHLDWVSEPATDPAILFVIRVRNAGQVECEVDVSHSAIADPTMEPDVWLAPGAVAEMLVVEVAPGCLDPEIDQSVQLVANGAPVDVTLDIGELAPWCQLSATAIYPL